LNKELVYGEEANISKELDPFGQSSSEGRRVQNRATQPAPLTFGVLIVAALSVICGFLSLFFVHRLIQAALR